MKYLVETDQSLIYYLNKYKVTVLACQHGHFEILKYLHEIGIKLVADCLTMTIERGHLSCLIYLIENDCNFGKNEYGRRVHRNCVQFLNKM